MSEKPEEGYAECQKCEGTGVTRGFHLCYVEGFGNTNMEICGRCGGTGQVKKTQNKP